MYIFYVPDMRLIFYGLMSLVFIALFAIHAIMQNTEKKIPASKGGLIESVPSKDTNTLGTLSLCARLLT